MYNDFLEQSTEEGYIDFSKKQKRHLYKNCTDALFLYQPLLICLLTAPPVP